MRSGGAGVFLVCFCLSGCSVNGAPSFDLFGAFFPAWLLCGIAGIAGAVVARLAFVSSGVADILPYQLAVCAAIGVARRPAVRLMADPRARGRFVERRICILPVSFEGPSQKTASHGPIQEHLARREHDEIVLLSALARGCSDRIEFVIDCRCRKVAAEIRGWINLLLKLNG
jgi:hypothetical protein